MILVAFKKVEGARAELEEAARRAIPSPENNGYFDEIAARKNDSSACESFTALLLLAKLARELEIDASDLVLRRGENGKPYFEGGALDFSISHSRGIVIVALSDSGAVGIDVEAAQISDDKAKKLAERYLSADVAYTAETAKKFLQVWVRKEACVKLFGATLAEVIGKEIPENVGFCDMWIFGFPASLCYFGEQTVKFYKNSSDFERKEGSF